MFAVYKYCTKLSIFLGEQCLNIFACGRPAAKDDKLVLKQFENSLCKYKQ